MNYKEVMNDFTAERFLTKPDLAMSMSKVSQWFGRTELLANICWHCSYTGDDPYTSNNVYIVEVLWS